ncbi:MAG: ATP-grasp domain-containing protein [Nitrospirota bacterium]|nr:ATP-grasp domain-containing protein [Nitrospirota bacterium]
MAHLLLLLPSMSYRGEAFLEAANKVGVSLTVAGDAPPDFLERSPDSFLTLDLHSPSTAVPAVVEFAKTSPINVVLGVNDQTAVLASTISVALGLSANSIDSVRAASNKQTMRRMLQKNGLPCPNFVVVGIDEKPADVVQRVTFPCVLKPLTLSGSCGVIRADDQASFQKAFLRIGNLLQTFARPEHEAPGRQILIEDFIPGIEVALEGLLTKHTFHPLAMFDKPDPLDGPYFEETLYVTPSRLPSHTQARIVESLAKAARAIGLNEGPVHGELRINDQDIWVIEVAARSIGGKCSRMLEFGTGRSLEELILLHALGRELPSLDLTKRAAGVMMMPIPREGILERVEGQDEARHVPGIEELVLTAKSGDQLIPLPEGKRYLGFILARGSLPELVEETLREAHRRLTVVMRPHSSNVVPSGIFRA